MSANVKQHQAAMVFDLNKCMGCQTCSVACKVLWTRDKGQGVPVVVHGEHTPGARSPSRLGV